MDKYYSRRIRETSDDTIDEYSENTSCRVMVEYFLCNEAMLPSVLLVRTLHSS
jgi:hypothetical protein